jgi:hypothetical protein
MLISTLVGAASVVGALLMNPARRLLARKLPTPPATRSEARRARR